MLEEQKMGTPDFNAEEREDITLRARLYGLLSLRWVFAVLLVSATGAVLGISARPANAGFNCIFTSLNTVVQPGTAGRGVRVNNPGMRIYNDVVECARLSSIFVTNSSGTKFVEMGWYEEDLANFICLPETTASVPRVFSFASNQDVDTCDLGNYLADEIQDNFSIADPDQDGVWVFKHETAQLWIKDMGSFNSGILLANSERMGENSEPGRGEFDGLDRLNASSNWVAWDNVVELPHSNPGGLSSDDPDYKDCIDTNTHVRMIREATAC